MAVAVVAGLLLTASACGGDDGDDERGDPTTTAPATESTTESTTTTTEPLTDEELVEQLVEDWWQALREMSAGDRPVEDARQFLAGDYLDRFLAERSGDEGDFVLSDESSIAVGAIAVDGDAGTVEVCVVDADFSAGSQPVSRVRRFSDSVDRTSSGWRIVRRERVGEVVEGVSCDE